MSAHIVFGSYMVRYPLGGMLSYVLQYLLGLRRLGHDVWFVEKAGYENACFDLRRGVMSDDCRYGVEVVGRLLEHHGLGDRWCFVDRSGRYWGADRRTIERAFRDADLFVDMGTHGSWMEEARATRRTVLIDGEPGFHQIKRERAQRAGLEVARYDLYYTNGRNVGTPFSPAPTAGERWRHLFHPVVTDSFTASDPPPRAPFTTVMNWRSHATIHHAGRAYGQKDVEFEKFLGLPSRTRASLELAVAGPDVPRERLTAHGWSLRDAHAVTADTERFVAYVAASAGEFAVCKNVFVALRTGWFSDRSAAYLASGRPVILQDTGFSMHLPCGEGLFAVEDVEQAAAALEAVRTDPDRHARAARALARAYLDTDVVLSRFVDEVLSFSPASTRSNEP